MNKVMTTDGKLPFKYQFDQPIDVLTAFDTLEIEHLEVSNERTIVIYNRTIFDIEVANGRLDNTRTLIVDVFELPPDMDAVGDPLPLVEGLIEEIATITVED